MSTKERAYEIFHRLDDTQLKDFISVFEDNLRDPWRRADKKKETFAELLQMLHPMEPVDYDEELATYRDAKYGINREGV